MKNIKLLFGSNPFNYKSSIIRLLTISGFIFGSLQYLILIVINEIYFDNPTHPLLTHLDFLTVILISSFTLLLFRFLERKHSDIPAHILIGMLFFISTRIQFNTGRWEVPLVLLALGVITAGVILKPNASLTYGIISLVLMMLLGFEGYSIIEKVSIVLTSGSTSFIAYLMGLIISDSFIRNKDQNEKLIEQISKNRNVEGLLVKRNSELKTLHSVGLALNSSLDVDEILSKMLIAIYDEREIYAASVWLVDPVTGKNVCRQVYGPDADIQSFTGIHLDPGRGIVGKTIATSLPVLVGDIRKDLNHLKKLAKKVKTEIRSIVSVPINLGDKCIGAIQLVHPEVDYFTEEDIETVKAISNMAATVLGKANLHAELKEQLKKTKDFGSALRQSDDKFRILAESTSTGIVILQKSKAVYVNPAVTEITGFTEEEIYTKGFLDFVHPDSHALVKRRAKARLAGKDVPRKYEARFLSKDGHDIWGDVSADLISLDGEPTIICTISDITKYKKAQIDLEKAIKIAQNSLRSKQEFLANIGHEIRTPLNAIVGISELLSGETTEEEKDEYLGIIKVSTNNLLAIINDLLDFSKMEVGKLRLREDIFNIHEVIEEVRKMVTLDIEEKGIIFTVEIDEDIPDRLIGDSFRLKQILINLLDNAKKFTSEGSVGLFVNTLKDSKNIIEICFEVVDSGRGIPEDKQEKIFETFEQVRIDEGRISKGMGLGLSIVKSLVKAHGGAINLTSKVGVGSNFTVKIKYRKAGIGESSYKNRNISRKVGQNSQIKRILLVDDNKINQVVAKNILNKAGFQVGLSSGGYSALRYLVKDPNKHDLILLDLELPDLSGFEVARRIRNDMKEPLSKIPIIALTAHAQNEIKKDVLESGMDDYLTKPFKPYELIDMINNYSKKIGNNPSIDLSYLKSATNNDSEIMREMIKQFFIQMEEVFLEIEKHIKSEDIKAISASIHQIKPSVTYMGIKKLKAAILDFEKIIKKRTPDFVEINKKVKEMNYLYKEATPELREFLEKE